MRFIESIGRTRNGDKVHKGIKSSNSHRHFAACNGSYEIDFFILHGIIDEIDIENNREVIYEFIRMNVHIDSLCQFCYPITFRLQYRQMIQAISQYKF